MLRSVATLGLAGALAACNSAPPRFDEHVCDGSSDVRLAAVLAGGGPENPGAQVISENGFTFLYVQGDCRAWVKPDGAWEPARSLQLTEQSSRELFEAVSLDSWHRLQGEYSSGAVDAPGLVLLTPSSKIVCGGGCSGGWIPLEVQRVTDSVFAQIARLSDAGFVLDGGVRFTAVPNSPGQYSWLEHLEWPLENPSLSASARPEAAQGRGQGIAVTDASGAAALRQLLREALARAGANFMTHVPARDDAGTTYRVFMRDMLPFESDAGLVSLPEATSPQR